MTIKILTSCTSQKAVDHENPLCLEDLLGDENQLADRLEALRPDALQAAELYRGQQHRRLMRGVRALDARREAGDDAPSIDLRIVSAGFGLIDANHLTPPYNVTFAGLRKKDRRALSDRLGIPDNVRAFLSEPADLHVILLGDDYADAACLTDITAFGGPALIVASAALARNLEGREGVTVVEIGRQDPVRFGTNLIGIRGEIAGRLLVTLADDPSLLGRLHEIDVLADLERRPKVSDPSVDWVIAPVPPRPEAARLRYFIPDWDDLVDPEYDFETETYRHGRGGWDHEVYAHQMLQRPAYDGLLVSRDVVQKSRRKKAHLDSLVGNGGVHTYLRIPTSFPVMGDCGAFSYAKTKVPPYSTDDVLDYYERLGFDYGVSVDHLAAVAKDVEQRRARYELTIANAEAFLAEHRARSPRFVPVGAIQGWDRATYREAARALVAMGYSYIAVGGLVMTRTEEVLSIFEAIREVVPVGVGVHAFGLARPEATADLVRLGVTSIDSASPLRKAWLDSAHNYWTPDGTTYAALRVPAPKSKWLPEEQAVGVPLATSALAAVRGVSARTASVSDALDRLAELERHVFEADYNAKVRKAIEKGEDPPKRPTLRPMREHYRRTLEDRPWEQCPCAICQDVGVEVAIFRGNNRNRRRGFHNTRIFHEMLANGLNGEAQRLVRAIDRAPLPLFEAAH